MESSSSANQESSSSGAFPPSFSWRIDNPGCLGDVQDQGKSPLCAFYSVADACVGNLALHKPNTNRPKVSIDKLAKEVAAHMPVFCGKAEGGGQRSSCPWTVLDHIKENGTSLVDNDNVQKLRIKDYKVIELSGDYTVIKVNELSDDHIQIEDDIKIMDAEIRPAILAGLICGEFLAYKNCNKYQYKDGVYKAPGGVRDDDGELHSVLITGYENHVDGKNGVHSLEIKNSWGIDWGEDGYGKIDPTLFTRFIIPIGVFIEGEGEGERAVENSGKLKKQSKKRGKKKQTFQDLAKEIAPDMESDMDKRMEYLLLSKGTIAAKRGPMTEEDEDELLLREAIYGVCGRGRGQERRVELADYMADMAEISTVKKLIRLFQNGRSGLIRNGMDYRKCVVSLLRYIKKLEGEGGNLEHKRVMVLVPPVDQNIWMEGLKSFFLVTNKRRHRGSFEIYVTTYEDVNKNPPPEFLWEYCIFDASGRRLSESYPVLDKLKAKFKLLITDYPEGDLNELKSIIYFLLPKFSDDLLPKLKERASKNENEILEELHSVLRMFYCDGGKDTDDEVNDHKEVTGFDGGISSLQKRKFREIYKMPLDATRQHFDCEQSLKQAVQLLKCSNHLSLFTGFTSFSEEMISNTGKMAVLDNVLPKLIALGRIVIVSQMTRMLDILEEYLKFRGHQSVRIDETSSLEECLFFGSGENDDKIRLLSTRAGCLGISLPVDILIFYDSNWNGHIDLEVINCAPKEAKVCCLVAKGTFEESFIRWLHQKLGKVEVDPVEDVCQDPHDVNNEWLVTEMRSGAANICQSTKSTIDVEGYNVQGDKGEDEKERDDRIGD